MSPVFVFGLGLALGLEHAFEPDHVAAVSTQVSMRKYSKKPIKQILKESISKSSLLGAIWGVGHTTSLVLIGFLMYVLAITIPDQIFSDLEFIVGLMLIFLGITTISNKKIIRFKHKHPHKHEDGTIHLEEHPHTDSEHNHGHKSYVIGLIHGLAGSGILVVLTATTLDSIEMVLGFILIFGIGSIVSMATIGGLMGFPFALVSKIPKIQKIFRYVTGLFSIMIGINILYTIGILDTLFL